MRRFAVVLLALGAMAIIGQQSCAMAFQRPAPLTPCTNAQTRFWCLGSLNESTVARIQAGNDKPQCHVEFSATACVDKTSQRRGALEFFAAADKYVSKYWNTTITKAGTGMLTFGNTVVWVICPVGDASGGAICYEQPSNPWPSQQVVDLDSLTPIVLGPRPNALGFGGFGGGGGLGGFPPIDDSEPICQASDLPGGTPAPCMSTVGMDCSMMACCPPLACFADASGASTCM